MQYHKTVFTTRKKSWPLLYGAETSGAQIDFILIFLLIFHSVEHNYCAEPGILNFDCFPRVRVCWLGALWDCASRCVCRIICGEFWIPNYQYANIFQRFPSEYQWINNILRKFTQSWRVCVTSIRQRAKSGSRAGCLVDMLQAFQCCWIVS